jgi:glucose 1-dehydrogenase
MKLNGKTALVTGAARGIGRGCALALAAEGADLLINDRTLTPEIESLAEEVTAIGRRAVVVEGDVFARPSCEAVVAAATAAVERIDILVSNPAYSHREDFLQLSPEKFDQVVQGTLYGGFHMSQLVARHMVATGDCGKIIFIASVQARMPFALSVPYNAAKAGLVQMAYTIANELLPYRINVNVIEPGWIDTPGEHLAFGDDLIRAAAGTLPWGRLGTPDDIGKAAVFLASDDADYITATSLRVDGGFWLRGTKPVM